MAYTPFYLGFSKAFSMYVVYIANNYEGAWINGFDQQT